MIDCGFIKENRWFRYRAAAIIVENDCALSACNETDDYFYSIGGGVHCGNNISCAGEINGAVNCGDNVACGDNIKGDVNCGGSIECKTIEGNVECQGNIIYK